MAPSLYFSDDTHSVAFMNEYGITVEQKVIDLFCGKDEFEDHISYILAHELAHYFLEHTWMRNSGLSYASSLGEFIEESSYALDQRKLAESQADLYAGFYSQIAGFNGLVMAQSTLEAVYTGYSLPAKLKGYPSYDERLTIISSKIKTARDLATVFEVGNILLMSDEYRLARDCYELILKNKLNSREIYNNLGLAYLLYAINISDNNIARWLYPISLEQTTRADLTTTRSGSFFDDPKKMLRRASQFFEKSILLDNLFLPAKNNLNVVKFLELGTYNERDRFINNDPVLNENVLLKYDLLVLNELISNDISNKAKRLSKRGSEISELNTSETKSNNNTDLQDELLEYMGIDIGTLVFFSETKNILGSNIRKGLVNNLDYIKMDEIYLFRVPKELIENMPENLRGLLLNTIRNSYFVMRN